MGEVGHNTQHSAKACATARIGDVDVNGMASMLLVTGYFQCAADAFQPFA